MVQTDIHNNSYSFSEAEMPTISPVKPEQNNHYDCGIYMLTYIEKIFQRFPQWIYKFFCNPFFGFRLSSFSGQEKKEYLLNLFCKDEKDMKRKKIREIINRCNRNENSTDLKYEEWLLRRYSAFETVWSQKSLLDEGAPLKENLETRLGWAVPHSRFPSRISYRYFLSSFPIWLS